MMTRKQFAATLSASMLFFAGPAYADITGSVNATITLTTGCIINGTNTNDGGTGANFGTLDFGSQTTLFTTADAEVLGTATGISVQCTSGVTPSLIFQAGQNDGLGTGGGNRAMQRSGQFVSYSLYSNAGRTTLLPIGGTIALANDGSAQIVPVYGRAFGATGLAAGTYTDVVTVVLDL